MTSIKVTVPDRMKAWVQTQTGDGGHARSSAYVRHLIRKDQIVNMQRLVDEPLASGISNRTPADILAEARKKAAERGLPQDA